MPSRNLAPAAPAYTPVADRQLRRLTTKVPDVVLVPEAEDTSGRPVAVTSWIRRHLFPEATP